MDGFYYFAYGQHMDPIHLRHLRIPVRFCVSAFLQNYRLVFNVLEDEFFRFEKRGLANIIPEAGNRVEGVLYEISEEDFVKLDNDVGVPELKYYRKLVSAYDPNGTSYSAMTYAGWPDVTARGLLPSGAYLRKIVDAASRNGMSNEFCHWLESHPTTI
jgi:hypothetical protein